MTCTHDLATKETACADGMCPICAANDARGYEFEIERLRAELTDAKARAKTAEANWHANEARLGKLEAVKKCAEKVVSLRGVSHGAWVIEELEAALKGSA